MSRAGRHKNRCKVNRDNKRGKYKLTQDEAERDATAYNRNLHAGERRWQAYPCECGAWHVGHGKAG